MLCRKITVGCCLMWLLGLFACVGAEVQPADAPHRWTESRAWRWYEQVGPVRGCNYLPRTSVNTTEMWQAGTFDPNTIDHELGWAGNAGYNSIRVFIQYIVWKADPKGLRDRIERLLAIADRHGISTMPVLFCDCSFAGKEPYLGRQDDPVPGVHNSGWTPSPGLKRVTDETARGDLERYVKDIVASFARDRRILVWDLYNEPGNSRMGGKSLPLVEAAFDWARQVGPEQPLTVAAWNDFRGPMSKRLFELSDVLSIHAYDGLAGVMGKINICKDYGRPILCTECLRRQIPDNNFAVLLPLFARNRIGWYNWGLVAGRTQTYMHWGSAKGSPVPKIWQHDIFHADGRPYDPNEIGLIRNFRF